MDRATMIERRFAEELRKRWRFDTNQQHTHNYHDREDFLDKVLPKLLSEFRAGLAGEAETAGAAVLREREECAKACEKILEDCRKEIAAMYRTDVERPYVFYEYQKEKFGHNDVAESQAETASQCVAAIRARPAPSPETEKPLLWQFKGIEWSGNATGTPSRCPPLQPVGQTLEAAATWQTGVVGGAADDAPPQPADRAPPAVTDAFRAAADVEAETPITAGHVPAVVPGAYAVLYDVNNILARISRNAPLPWSAEAQRAVLMLRELQTSLRAAVPGEAATNDAKLTTAGHLAAAIATDPEAGKRAADAADRILNLIGEVREANCFGSSPATAATAGKTPEQWAAKLCHNRDGEPIGGHFEEDAAAAIRAAVADALAEATALLRAVYERTDHEPAEGFTAGRDDYGRCRADCLRCKIEAYLAKGPPT